VACGPQRRSSDADFHLLEEVLSPDGTHVLLTYNYDIGATGYSRVWWAVVPRAYGGLNLAHYELPDAWRATGWSPSGEILVEKWVPYYYPDGDYSFETGDLFHGVTIRVVEPEAGQGPSPTAG
jgi:hypothetical protein